MLVAPQGFAMTGHRISSGWVVQERVCVSVQDGSQGLLYSKLKVTSCHFCHIPWVWSKSQSPAHIQGGRIIEGHGYQEGSLGLALETAYHSTVILFSINPRQNTEKMLRLFLPRFSAFSITLLQLQWGLHLGMCNISTNWSYRNSWFFTS